MASSGSNTPRQTIARAAMGLQVFRWIVLPIAVGFFVLHQPGIFKMMAVFLGTLGILVFVHELGHYQFARWAGMKVNRFGIGFPPWIYTVRRNDIDYSIGALPIGGMVDIAGLGSEEEMVATAQSATASHGVTTAATTVENIGAHQNATTAQVDDYLVRHPDAPRGQKQFQDARLGWRFMTLFAGPMMNFGWALLIYISLFSIVGLPITTATPRIEDVMAGMPAAKAGLQSGDVITAVNGQSIKDTNQISDLISAAKAKSVEISVLRGTQTLKMPMAPIMDEAEAPNGKIVQKPMIGVAFTQRIIGNERVSVLQAAELGVLQSLDLTKQIGGLLKRVFTGKMSKMDKRSVGGPVKIAQVIGRGADEGWQVMLLKMAGLSVNLGLMNLLPFPALDGGRILFLGYEMIMRRPINAQKEGLVHMVGMVMLLAFMLFITVRDVVPMIQRH